MGPGIEFLLSHPFDPSRLKCFHVQNGEKKIRLLPISRVLGQHFRNSKVLYKYKTLVFIVVFPAYHKYRQLHICTVNSCFQIVLTF